MKLLKKRQIALSELYQKSTAAEQVEQLPGLDVVKT